MLREVVRLPFQKFKLLPHRVENAVMTRTNQCLNRTVAMLPLSPGTGFVGPWHTAQSFGVGL